MTSEILDIFILKYCKESPKDYVIKAFQNNEIEHQFYSKLEIMEMRKSVEQCANIIVKHELRKRKYKRYRRIQDIMETQPRFKNCAWVHPLRITALYPMEEYEKFLSTIYTKLDKTYPIIDDEEALNMDVEFYFRKSLLLKGDYQIEFWANPSWKDNAVLIQKGKGGFYMVASTINDYYDPEEI